jgi:PKD repeat protein
MFNGASVGGMWDFGSVSGPQVAVLTRDVKDRLRKTGNLAEIQSTSGETPAMAPIQQFLVIDYGAMDDEPTTVNLTSATLEADFSGGPLTGNATLSVTFRDLSAGSPTGWAWDFDNNGIVDNTTQYPQYSYLNPGLYSVNLTVGNGTAFSTLVKTNYISVWDISGASLQETILQDTVTGTTEPAITESGTSHPEPLTILSVTDTTGGTPDQQESSTIAELLMQFLLDVASHMRESFSPLASRMPFLQEIQRAI